MNAPSVALPALAFPSSRRLRGRSAFDRVHRRGARAPTRDLTVLVHPSPSPHVRLGMAVSRKVGNAVVRNRLRRRIREIVRLHQAELPGWDLVVVARPTAARLVDEPFDVLARTLMAAIRQARQRARASTPGSPPAERPIPGPSLRPRADNGRPAQGRPR